MHPDTTALTFIAFCLPFLGALVAPLLTRLLGANAAWPLALVPALVCLQWLGFAPEVSRGEVVTGGYAWVPSYNVSFSWLIDGLSLTFLLLISGIGTLIVLYSGGYLKGHEHLGRFFSFILMFMGSMLGLVASDSFLMLFIFWEMTSITSFLLIGFDHAREASRRAALQALVVTGGGGLFLLAGLIDHEAGTRDIRRLGGLRRAMPITFAAALLAALSMGGLPPFFGFLAKEEIYLALWALDIRAITFTLAAVIGNGLMFAVAFAVALKPFLGPEVETPKHAHEGPILLWLGPVVLAVTGLLAGLFSAFAHSLVTSPLASAVAGTPQTVTISTIPHVGMALLLSVVTVAFGIAVYLVLDRARAAADRLVTDLGWGPDRGFDQFITGLVRLSSRVARLTQPGLMEVYMTVTFGVIAFALIAPMAWYGEWPRLPVWPADVQFHELAFMVIAVVGVVGTLMAKNRLNSILALGIQGFAVAVLFLLFGAPDLSFTQFMVETLSVVILALVMTRLRLEPRDHRPFLEKLPDAVIAIACGLGFMLYLMRVTQGRFDTALTDFFNLYSKTIAHGANVVNVIIVDFRGTDTLGEIAVVMVTGLAILSLIRIRVGRPAEPDATQEVKP